MPATPSWEHSTVNAVSNVFGRGYICRQPSTNRHVEQRKPIVGYMQHADSRFTPSHRKAISRTKLHWCVCHSFLPPHLEHLCKKPIAHPCTQHTPPRSKPSPYKHMSERPGASPRNLNTQHATSTGTKGEKEEEEASSRKDLHHPIPTRRNDEPTILAPLNIAHALTAHRAMRHDFLRANALLQRPEADAGVVAGRHGFAAVFGEREGGDGRGVREHVVRALACWGVEVSKR